MKETKYFTYEITYAFQCPHCSEIQGYTNEIDEDNFRESRICKDCRQEFKLTR